MKTLVLTICLAVSGACLAQSEKWAPVGATWWYGQSQISPPWYTSYHKISAVKDTVVSGISVRVLKWEVVYSTGSSLRTSLYTFEDSGRVYFMVPEDARPYLLYDFTLDEGDSVWVYWWEYGSIDSTLQTIDSIAMTNYGGMLRKELHIKRWPGVDFWNGPWVEGIGSLGYFFSQNQIADPPDTGALTCYEDSINGLIHFYTWLPCDSLSPVGISLLEPAKINIHPNPTTSTVRIESPGSANSLLTLYTLTGRKVQQVPLTGLATDVDVSGLAQSEKWAPVGAKWWYTTGSIQPGRIERGTLEVTKDTILAGLNCRQLRWSESTISADQFYYIHVTDSTTYYVRPVTIDSNVVCKLYDHERGNLGDTIEIPCVSDSSYPILYLIDSIGTEVVNGDTLWKQHIKWINPLPTLEFDGWVIERLGHTRFFIYTYFNNSGCLRCYSDSSLQYTNEGTCSLPCDYTGFVGIENAVPKGGTSVSVYPNPAQDLIYVEVPFHGIWEYRLWDARGANVSYGDFTFTSETISISRNLPGIYLLMVSERQSGYSTRLRVVKME